MHRKISVKLFSWILFLYILTFTLLNTVGIHRIEQKITSEKISTLYQEAQVISSEYLSNFFDQTSSIINIKGQLSAVDTFLGVRIWAVTKTGDIIVDTRGKLESNYKNLNDVAPELLERNYIKNTTLGDSLSEPSLVVCYTINSEFHLQGYLVLAEPVSSIRHEAEKYIYLINISMTVLAVLLLATCFYLLYTLVHPIRILDKGIHEYANGNFNYQIKLKGNSEYADFVKSINYMASELANLEEYQKKFVANISHDFRSPLTSIKGYAEAMKDGTIPYEMQDKYLDIILFESERLTKLTSNLLTLNNIKHNGALLDISSFDMNQVIKSTATTFEGICTKKRITFQLLFESKEALVCADIGKIQQVLYNLIDNAIKFSPKNSVIQIRTEEKNDKLFISVKDYGSGIPTDSLHKIWERFYKTDPSRGRDKKGTGLGLSIVKEIINAHDENITVASTIDVGTEFIFTLPLLEGD